MRKHIFKTGILLLLVITLNSCEKEQLENIEPKLKDQSISASQSEGIIILGKQLEDPYSIKNMEKAYLNLKAANPKTPDHKIKPTHMYIRFLPANNGEWDLLKMDSTIMLFDFPLDYEIKNLGTFYHDPSLPEDAITWQYCVLPIGYNIPNVQHELLYEIYIPSKDKNSSEINQFLFDLEYESVKLTGNLPENYNNLNNSKGAWKPKGTIKVWDDIIGKTTTVNAIFDHWEYYDCDEDNNGEYLVERIAIDPIEQCRRPIYRYEYTTSEGSYIPLVGVKVSARWFTRVEIDLTDENGYFETASFLYTVNYAIKWERSFYDIRDGLITQAWYNGPEKSGDWNLKIGSGKSIMYATIHRAAHKHYYGNNLGIRRPVLATKTKLCYIDDKGSGDFWGEFGEVLLPEIRIFGKSNLTGIDKNTNEIFGVTAHELGHLSHWYFVGIGDYWQTSETIYESWATAIEWALTNDEYHTKGLLYGGNNAIIYDHEDGYQLWAGGGSYTPIFIDLIDSVNQRTEYNSLILPNDRIAGYTLVEIQNNILRESYGLSSLSDAIKDNKISGITDSDIDELFTIYW